MAKRSNPVMSYIPGKSVIHALTGTTKLVFFLLFTFCQYADLRYRGCCWG